jgi:hypothetical protein
MRVPLFQTIVPTFDAARINAAALFRRSVCGAALLFTTGAGIASIPTTAYPQSLLPWPNADTYWGVLVNVNQYITYYLQNDPTYFTNVKLATDLEVVQVNYNSSTSVAAAQNAYATAYSTMTAKGIMTGNYISGTNVMPMADESQYPYSIISEEEMPAGPQYCGVWPGETFRQFVCNTDEATLAAFHVNIAKQWQQFPAPIHFVDNAASEEGGDGGQTWASQCQNMKELNQIAQSLGSRAIFNISMLPGAVSDSDMSLLIDALQGGGVSVEQPWEDVVRNNASLTANAVKQYRQLLDAGIAVIMIETNGSGQATPQQLKSWVLTWRKPGDPLYLSQIFWQQPDPSIYFLQ